MRTADHLRQAIAQFLDLVIEAETRLNELNVFPVADSDTGTNVRRTFEAVLAEISLDRDADLGEVAAGIARASMMYSRGNSGLILGQYLTGFSADLIDDPWPEEWANALQVGAAKARLALSDPVEGTVLTVADAAAKAKGQTVPDLLTDAAARADAAVVQTRYQLEVLTERGVVDAGGVALALFLRALADVVTNEPEFTIANRVVARPARRKGDADEGLLPEVVGYELQFNCDTGVGPITTAAQLQNLLASLGTDVVVGSNESVLSAHVHASRIGPVLEAVLFLSPFNIRVEALLETPVNGATRV